MATFNKIQDYVEQVNKAVHNWSTHTFKVVFCNVAIIATNTILADLTQISNGGGYTGGAGGGLTLDTVTLSEASGTAKVTIADEVFTASGASVGPFRYIGYYNDSATSPADALVCWFDYGSSLTLADTETFTLDHDATNGLWQMVQPMSSNALLPALKQIEDQIASLQAQVGEIDARLESVDAEIDAIVAQQQALEAQAQALVPKLAEARGMPAADYLSLKRRLGELATLRMSMRRELGLTRN